MFHAVASATEAYQCRDNDRRASNSANRRDGQNGDGWCRLVTRSRSKELALLYQLQDRFFTERESLFRSGEFELNARL